MKSGGGEEEDDDEEEEEEKYEEGVSGTYQGGLPSSLQPDSLFLTN